MSKYYYFPILKTRSSEVAAYEALEDIVKDEILPIIEMTGALGYTYPKNYKIESERGKHRDGNICDKIKKILDLVGQRKFILDITDDESLKYDGLSDRNGGLLDHTNGYKAWLDFLKKDHDFQQQVIPTIQFNTSFPTEVEQQVKSLDTSFDYVATKLPAFLSGKNTFDSKIIFNPRIQQIINWIIQNLTHAKLIIILDFGYIKEFSQYQNLIANGLQSITDLSKVFALIPVSSSFPNFVANVGNPFPSAEIDIFNSVKSAFPNTNNVYCGDYSSIHPTKYEMGGGGWIPRIDYVIRDNSGRPTNYAYFRGSHKNTSSEYIGLAKQVVAAPSYSPITQFSVVGDQQIAAKAASGAEGKAPSYWISVRSNIYMTTQYLYLKAQGSFLVL